MSVPLSPVVDVIVPVYRGMDATRECVRSVLDAPVTAEFRLIVIDDASPEPELSRWIDALRHQDSRVRVLRNERNQGFVRSVNRGMAQDADHDVVLLNSDTRVYGNWLDRLRDCAYRDRDTGTVTPLTNNGTLAAYPRFMAENPVGTTDEGAALDALAARVNAGQSVVVPTAVGFCMYIRRDCLEQTGLFDAESFGRGYGEENDFCMRAAELGWAHRLCGDVFVHHHGGVSFGGDGQELRRCGGEALARKFPDYQSRVAAFVARDPGRELRRRLDMARLDASPRPRILFITHRQGGGVERHCRDLAEALSGDAEILALEPVDSGWLRLHWLRAGEEMALHFRMPVEFDALCDTLKALRVCRVHVHHVMEQPLSVLRLPEVLGVPMDFTLHDYYSICPQYNLTDERGDYCGEPDETGCARCLAARPAPWGLDIRTWRDLFRRLLEQAERVIAPSEDVRARMTRYVPDAPVRVIPNFTASRVAAVPRPAPVAVDGEARVLILGVVNPAKGVFLLERCAWDARRRGLPLRFIVIGRSETPIRGLEQLPLTFTGGYEAEALPALIAEARGHVFFFPSRAPETFSYTLSEALDVGLPLVAPDRGAFTERTRGLGHVVLLPAEAPADEWNDRLLQMARIGMPARPLRTEGRTG